MREVLADGERHSFLEAKSRTKVRKPPIKRKEKPLVDLPLTDKVSEPPRIQNGVPGRPHPQCLALAVWHASLQAALRIFLLRPRMPLIGCRTEALCTRRPRHDSPAAEAPLKLTNCINLDTMALRVVALNNVKSGVVCVLQMGSGTNRASQCLSRRRLRCREPPSCSWRSLSLPLCSTHAA